MLRKYLVTFNGDWSKQWERQSPGSEQHWIRIILRWTAWYVCEKEIADHTNADIWGRSESYYSYRRRDTRPLKDFSTPVALNIWIYSEPVIHGTCPRMWRSKLGPGTAMVACKASHCRTLYGLLANRVLARSHSQSRVANHKEAGNSQATEMLCTVMRLGK